jgi:tryptophan synthase beta chain
MQKYFGNYGGCYAAETLVTPLQELEAAWLRFGNDPQFLAELDGLLRDYVGRPTPLTLAARLSEHLGGATIYLKREDLAHSGAHKINNALGQALLAKKMGKTRVVAETGAGQHGVAAATACALLGLKCIVYQGEVDMGRQALNVARMQMLGAEVRPVTSGQKTLKDATSQAIRDWVSNARDTFYLLGSALGPHPYPTIVREFQRVIGIEARRQIIEKTGKLPDLLIACVGGGSNAIGLFYDFLNDPSVRFIGVEAGGHGIASGEHAARFQGGKVGVLQGMKTYLLQDKNGQILNTHSVSAGLDYAGIGPEHAHLHDIGRVEYTYATDDEALAAASLLAQLEGILPALESAHAIAQVIKSAPLLPRDQVIIVNVSGRGDKDMTTYIRELKLAEASKK